ncbi:MAG: hypothetical protein B5M52_06015 [Helicobacteraceae bacterium 4484_230]|nr:MAG: hypothetical protein B5M52_06015 [Helicobacteraceae bacterium 4484_230]
MSKLDLDEMLDTTNFDVSNVRLQIVYSGEGDCVGDDVDLTRVAIAKLDYKGYGESAKDVMDVAFYVNGDEYDRVFSLYIDMDNNVNTGLQVSNGAETIGADKIFQLDYQSRNIDSFVVNYEEVPQRLKAMNNYIETAAGNVWGTGWYMMSVDGFAKSYFTAHNVRAIATVDSFKVGKSTSDITYLGLSDITPVFEIHPF